MAAIQATVIYRDSEMYSKQEMDFLRGYAIGIGGGRGSIADTEHDRRSIEGKFIKSGIG